jgi:hypothetical protein
VGAGAQEDAVARFAHAAGDRLVDRARAEQRVQEGVDQGARRRFRRGQELAGRVAQQRGHVEARDALTCPVGVELVTRHAPHLLGVRQDVEVGQRAAKGVDGEVFEAPDRAPEQAAAAGDGPVEERVADARRPQGGEDLRGVERVVEEGAVDVLAGLAAHRAPVFEQQIADEVVQVGVLREEPMWTMIGAEDESVLLYGVGARQPAHGVGLIDEEEVVIGGVQLHGRRHASGAGAEDEGVWEHEGTWSEDGSRFVPRSTDKGGPEVP